MACINNNLKKRLNNGESVLGTWCLLASEAVVNVIAKSGMDFVLIDMEHGPIDHQLAMRMAMAAQSEGVEALVRVSSNDESQILKALDCGASGVIVPHINTVRDRIKAVSFIKYPPEGLRGYSPYTRSAGYVPEKDYTVNENKRVISGIIVEGAEGIANIEAIANDPGVDLIYIGAYDISASLGIPGEVNDPKVVKILEECVGKIRKLGKAAGALFHSDEELKFFKSIGIQFLCYRVDSDIIYSQYERMAKVFRK